MVQKKCKAFLIISSNNINFLVGKKTFNVKGTGMEDHGDSHAEDGFCNAVRIANVKGKVSKGKFKSESFALIGSK